MAGGAGGHEIPFSTLKAQQPSRFSASYRTSVGALEVEDRRRRAGEKKSGGSAATRVGRQAGGAGAGRRAGREDLEPRFRSLRAQLHPFTLRRHGSAASAWSACGPWNDMTLLQPRYKSRPRPGCLPCPVGCCQLLAKQLPSAVATRRRRSLMPG